MVCLFLVACKDGPTDPEEPKTEQITKTITPTDGSSTLPNATLYDDDSGDELGVGETDLTRDEGTTLSIRAEADGFHSETQSVSFASASGVEIALEADNPEEVAIDFEIRDNETDSLVAGDIIADGDSTVAEDKVSGTIFLPYSETPVELCAEAKLYNQVCEDFIPDKDGSVNFLIDRREVTVTLEPVFYGKDGKELEPVGDYSEDIFSSYEVDLYVEIGNQIHEDSFIISRGFDNPKAKILAGQTTDISGSAYYGRYRDLYFTPDYLHYHLMRMDKRTITAEKDTTINIHFDNLVPACRDEHDNNTNGVIDENEPGCVDSDLATSAWPDEEGFIYEPDDNNESLDGWQVTLGSTAGEETKFVSGADGEQEFLIMPSHVQALDQSSESIRHAVEITVETEIKVSASQTGEEFALEWYTGPDDDNLNTVNMTEIAEDQGRDGWVFAEFRDIDRDFFSNGTSYEVLAIHGTKIRGEKPTDGNDDVIFLEAGDETTRSFIIEWYYEPEEVPEDSQKAKPSATQSGVSSKTLKDVTGRQ